MLGPAVVFAHLLSSRRAPRPRSRLPHAPLVLLCGALALASVPLWEQAPAWAAALLVFSLLARLAVNFYRLPVPPLSWRLLVLAASLLGILFNYQTFLGVEPGFGVLLVLISLKALEANTERDFTVLTLLGFFLGLCGLFFSQEMDRWLYTGLTTTLLTASMARLHLGTAPHALLRSLRLSAVMLVQALPVVVLLFLFCPRPSGDFRLFLGSSMLGLAGMSEHLQPGSIAGVANSTEEAFRAGFPRGELPPPQARYWRSIVLWAGDGLVWDRSPPALREAPPDRGRGPELLQKITLRPQGNRWLVALDRPIDTPKLADAEAGGTLRSHRTVMTRTTYYVTSRPLNNETELTPEVREAALRRPARVSPEVQGLADSLRKGAADEREVAERALEYFRHGGFKYSTEPGKYLSNELDEFLFRRRIGFCEHYATAFASLMRLAGVPSRVVCGYLGGEYNQIGNYFVVRQSDAHAWCEVWVAGQGWVRVDPTSVTAPDRISQGMQNFLAAHEGGEGGLAGRLPGRQVWNSLFREGAMFWDNLSYQWDTRVLTFNAETQQSFFAAVGLGNWQTSEIAVGLLAAVGLVVSALAAWLRRSARPADRLVRSFQGFARRLARAGAPVAAGEAPLTYTRRVAEAFPESADEIREVGRLYTKLRYGRTPGPAATFQQALRRVGKLRRVRAAKTEATPSAPARVYSSP